MGWFFSGSRLITTKTIPHLTSPLKGGGTQSNLLHRDRLARIHDVVRVECLLDCAHDVNTFTVLSFQCIQFVNTDAVFAGAGAAHFNRD